MQVVQALSTGGHDANNIMAIILSSRMVVTVGYTKKPHVLGVSKPIYRIINIITGSREIRCPLIARISPVKEGIVMLAEEGLESTPSFGVLLDTFIIV